MNYRLNHGSKTMAIARPTVRPLAPIRSPSIPFRVPRQHTDVGAPVGELTTSATESLNQPAGRLKAVVLEALGQLGGWWSNTDASTSQGATVAQVGGLVDDAKVQDNMKDNVKEATQPQRAPPSILGCLKPVSTSSLKVARIMSSLSNLAYDIGQLTPHMLWRRHRLHLVTMSNKNTKEETSKVKEAALCGDGMTTTPPDTLELFDATGTMDLNNIVTIEEKLRKTPVVEQNTKGTWDGTTKAIAKATMLAASSVSSAAGSIYQRAFVELVKQAVYSTSAEQVLGAISNVMSVLYASLSFKGVLGTTTTEAPTVQQDSPAASAEDEKIGGCPFEWYVADDPKHKLRIFAIQGSVGLDTWQINLTFDPVIFEDKSLGVRVHRGAYETAQYLYGMFEPLVKQHMATSPDAKITFTGHSLGGSLGTLLALMFVHRGVIPPEAISPVYTFGAAAVFCEGAVQCSECGTCAFASSCDSPMPSHAGPTKALLEQLGMPLSSVVNVMMHRDIVPRAFACDYSSVVPLLRSVGSSFREHSCLGAERAKLYSFVGDVLILQPCESQKFVKGEGYHPMLPQVTGLYKITNHDSWSAAAECCVGIEEDKNGSVVSHRRDALLSLMDSPHPLEILANPGAYGDGGLISRYHNPENYIRGLRSVLKNNQPTKLGELVKAIASKRRASGLMRMEPKFKSYPSHNWKIRSTYGMRKARHPRAVQKSALTMYKRGNRSDK